MSLPILFRPLLAASLCIQALAGAPPPVSALVRALGDTDPRVREDAAAALGRMGPAGREAVEPLAAALGHADPYFRGAAAAALGRMGGAAVPVLARILGEGAPPERVPAAIALGRAGVAARPAIPALLRALEDPDADLRAAAAAALGEAAPGAGEAIPALTERLWDRDEAVRRAAALALRRADPAGTDRLAARSRLPATLDRIIPALMAEHHVPGVSVAVIQEGRVAWTRAYGVRRAGGPEPVTADTVFEAASMSKPVLGLVALQLADSGHLRLDRPLAAYAPEPAVPHQPERERITARMALSHTTGLPNWRPGGEEQEGPLQLLFQPGTRFSYSGEGIFLLQRALERIAGRPLDVLAERGLFGPLGLKHTGFRWTPGLGAAQASGHGDGGEPLPLSSYLHPNGAYTLYTTAQEYAALLTEAMKAQEGRSALLSRRSAREMLHRQVRAGGRDPIERPGTAQGLEAFWGLGWSLNATNQGDIAHHGGSNRTGFRCFSQFSPSRRTGLVILTNGTQGGDLWSRVVAMTGDL